MKSSRSEREQATITYFNDFKSIGSNFTIKWQLNWIQLWNYLIIKKKTKVFFSKLKRGKLLNMKEVYLIGFSSMRRTFGCTGSGVISVKWVYWARIEFNYAWICYRQIDGHNTARFYFFYQNANKRQLNMKEYLYFVWTDIEWLGKRCYINYNNKSQYLIIKCIGMIS